MTVAEHVPATPLVAVLGDTRRRFATRRNATLYSHEG